MNNNSKVLVMENLHLNGVKEEMAPVAPKKLSNREIEVLMLICKELSPGEISERLNISEKTFFNHRSNILDKTGARTNIGIYKFGLRNGLTVD
jgi:DNA-binding CsgD family transcriptional regulator